MEREQRQQNGRGNGNGNGGYRYNRHRNTGRRQPKVESDQQSAEQQSAGATATAAAAAANGAGADALIINEGPSRVMLTLAELETRNMDDLTDMAKELDISGISRLKKQDLAFRILQAQTEQQGNIFKKGILDIMEDGFGFMRLNGYLPNSSDIYVSQSQIRRFGLRTGDMVVGQVRAPKEGEKYYSLLRVEAVNDVDAETAKKRPHFGDLTPIFPQQMLNLETTQQTMSTRLLNLVAPVGRGQRGLIVSPPKAGKTMLLKSIANSVTSNY